ncbi:hypothetical protein HYH02_005015 [Chlamydomonas schloesseri]|uniref:Bifunctional inhibitor/plant lipid transfer protein/seed storage helical domain-containing protein n=1 Tax=Chlamydomonas schloesseri TaxID=2026947 RepID=A0A835WNJ3_9CHLO|nr:hypothetical protein HYH02_005015 [Chlamydomonas schloesseri]|eukprot:KAG2450514.1 hypothetical protein HYH02_005015 [Chlamydomonas schloesseri]
MSRSRITAACGLLAALLLVAGCCAAVAQTTSTGGGEMDTTQLCKEAEQQLPGDPNISAFKQCAATKPIPQDCCAKLAPYAKYLPCLKNPDYRAAVEAFLSGTTSIDEIRTTCLV